jgi:AAA-like domain
MWLSFIEWVFIKNNEITVKQKHILRARYPSEGERISSTELSVKSFKDMEGFSKATIDREVEKVHKCWGVRDDIAGAYNEPLQNWLQQKFVEYKKTLISSDSSPEYIAICELQSRSLPLQQLVEPEQLLDVPMSEEQDELSGEFQQEVAARQKIVNPITVMKLEQPGGLVSLDSPFYMACNKEFQMSLETIATLDAKGLVRIKSPRQMGKTSLLERILNDCNCKKWRTVKINLQTADSQSLQSTAQFLKWFFQQIISQLKLPIKLSQVWDDSVMTNVNCSEFFEDYLLKSTELPLVLAIDSLDIIFDYRDIANDFLGYLRTWIDDDRRYWPSLRIAIVHTWHYETEKLNRSPLNIGKEIKLPDLTVPQIQNLLHLHALDWNDRNILDLTNLVGGHPYLIRLALYHIANGDTTLSSLLTDAHTGNSIYIKYLQRQEKYITSDRKLIDLMAKVVNRDCPLEIRSIDSGSLVKLQELGLVENRCNAIQPKNQLLKLYFMDRL